MIKVGIDTLAIYTPSYALNLSDLALARGVDPNKYTDGLGQLMMSVPPPGEDTVTMGANAALQVLRGVNKDDIEMLLFATESGIDQSKAAGIYLHDLLDLPDRCRVVELKQACYAGTAAIQFALPYLRENPNKKILVVASDVARYGLGTTGESSQGAGAVALLLCAYPRVLSFESEFGVVTENIMDFWRPNYSDHAFVDGKYSSKVYLQMLEKTWKQYASLSNRNISQHDYFCYHTPVPRLVEKAHQHLCKLNNRVDGCGVSEALHYPRLMGNSYTASLYASLASLLDQVRDNLAGKRIGFYSYGSGCVAEFFSGVVEATYRDALHSDYHAQLFSKRKLLSVSEYETFFQFQYVEDGSEQIVPEYETGCFRLVKMNQHQRGYEYHELPFLNVVEDEKKSSHQLSPLFHGTEEPVDERKPTSLHQVKKVSAPGKLILSGEHAVVYGSPAIAMAINRYVTASVTSDPSSQIKFDLTSLAYRNHTTLSALKLIKDRIKGKYHRFIRGEFSIRDVLQKPFELAQFAFGLFADNFNISLPHGVKIEVQSDLPIGCGLGSSAATILSVMHAVSEYLQLSIPEETLLKLAQEAENMQHGHSSGLDLRVALFGGCLYVHGQHSEKRDVPSIPMYLVNTGTPQSSTGQCIEKVKSYFKTNQLHYEFSQVTNIMDQSLKQKDWLLMRSAIRENHKLLTHIGVVPETVQQFIAQAETINASAKICGAGSVVGEQAGAVWVVTDDESALNQLCERYGYSLTPLSGELRGMYAA